MIINGFQKMTLLDFPGKVACTVFTAGCNFRCPFCHNASLVTHIDEKYNMSEQEILDFLKKRNGLLDGVCITGGEPLLNTDIANFIGEIKKLGFAVKLDTNGSRPELLKELIDKNLLDCVAMDIKNSKEKYADTIGIAAFDITPIERSVEILLEGKIDYEFRTTIVKEYHTIQDIEKIGQWIQGAKNYFLQNFVDSGDLISGGLSPVSKDELHKMCTTAQDFVINSGVRGI